jgi:monoamine oxidase
MRLYSIEGGNQRLVDELEARVHATKKLNQRVTSVGRGSDDRLQVTSAHGDATETQSFDFVIVALPINHLPSVEFRGERLAAAMRAHHAHYDHPAHYLRISILFQRAFWRGRLSESYFMLDRFHGCCVYDETSREPEADHGVLGWLIGGETAAEMSNFGDDVLIERALESLAELFPESREQFVEGKVHRWINAVNAIPGGRIPRNLDRRHQPEPSEHPDLFVVGDYLFDSTLNGVLDSAEYVTGWLAAQFAEPDCT